MFLLIQFILLVLLFSIQSAVLGGFSVAGIVPDLALIYVVYCGIFFPGSRGAVMGLVVGFIQDCLSGGLLGINTLSKSLIGFFFSTLKDKLFVEGILPICLFVVASSIFDGLIFYVIFISLLKGDVGTQFLYTKLPIFALYNAFLAPLIFFILNKNRKWILDKIPTNFFRPL